MSFSTISVEERISYLSCSAFPMRCVYIDSIDILYLALPLWRTTTAWFFWHKPIPSVSFIKLDYLWRRPLSRVELGWPVCRRLESFEYVKVQKYWCQDRAPFGIRSASMQYFFISSITSKKYRDWLYTLTDGLDDPHTTIRATNACGKSTYFIFPKFFS